MFLTREGRYRHNITLDFARANYLEFFWTLRMNDTHDATNELLLPEFKKQNPDLLFGSPQNRPRFGAWSGVDYGDARVRELTFRFVEEVAENYDVDGILLDFFRHPVLFKKAAWGDLLGQSELDQLTGLVRRIRERLSTIGASSRKPILLAVRVPDGSRCSIPTPPQPCGPALH